MAGERRGKAIPRNNKAPAADTQDRLAESKRLLEVVRASLEDDKAEDLVTIELADKSSIADFMMIASGRSHRQVGAMAEHVREKLKAAGVKGVSIEGAQRCDWVLIDAGDVLVHLFRPEVRAFYNLEKMWGLELPANADQMPAQAAV